MTSCQGCRKINIRGNNKGESRGIREKKFVDERFLEKIQLVGNRKPINSVDSINV